MRLIANLPQAKPQKRKKLYEKFLDILKPSIAITDNEFNKPEDFEDIDSESEIEIDESEEYPEEWGI